MNASAHDRRNMHLLSLRKDAFCNSQCLLSGPIHVEMGKDVFEGIVLTTPSIVRIEKKPSDLARSPR